MARRQRTVRLARLLSRGKQAGACQCRVKIVTALLTVAAVASPPRRSLIAASTAAGERRRQAVPVGGLQDIAAIALLRIQAQEATLALTATAPMISMTRSLSGQTDQGARVAGMLTTQRLQVIAILRIRQKARWGLDHTRGVVIQAAMSDVVGAIATARSLRGAAASQNVVNAKAAGNPLHVAARSFTSRTWFSWNHTKQLTPCLIAAAALRQAHRELAATLSLVLVAPQPGPLKLRKLLFLLSQLKSILLVMHPLSLLALWALLQTSKPRTQAWRGPTALPCPWLKTVAHKSIAWKQHLQIYKQNYILQIRGNDSVLSSDLPLCRFESCYCFLTQARAAAP